MEENLTTKTFPKLLLLEEKVAEVRMRGLQLHSPHPNALPNALPKKREQS